MTAGDGGSNGGLCGFAADGPCDVHILHPATPLLVSAGLTCQCREVRGVLSTTDLACVTLAPPPCQGHGFFAPRPCLHDSCLCAVPQPERQTSFPGYDVSTPLSDDQKQLYQTLEMQKATVGANIMGSAYTYNVPKAGDVEVSLNPAELEAYQDPELAKEKYDRALEVRCPVLVLY